MTRLKALVGAVVQGLALGGCSGGGDSGACVKEVTFGNYTYCNEDWDRAECETQKGPDAPGGTLHAGETCEDLGYTYYCKSTYTYHKSSSTCD